MLNMQWIYIQLASYALNRMTRGHLTIYSMDKKVALDIHRTDEFRGEIYTEDFGELCKQLVKRGDIGLGELFMQGKWYSPNTLELIMTLLLNDRELQTPSFGAVLSNDKKNIKHHYDVGNDFYMQFLRDDLKAYTCGFFLCPGDGLNEAQNNKVNIIVKKMETQPGQKILDIGCGWGTIAAYVADITKTRVDGVTLSDEQEAYILKTHPKMTVFNMSYEDLPSEVHGTYDRIFSIGMFEHVRCPNYETFFKKAAELLTANGRMVLHTITHSSIAVSTCAHQNESFISEYIFPGGQIPKREWITSAASKTDLKLVHMEVFGGQHYAKTLGFWRKYMMERIAELKGLGYKDEFIRMYEYYFVICEAAFYSDKLNITQFVYEKATSLRNVSNSFQCNKL